MGSNRISILVELEWANVKSPWPTFRSFFPNSKCPSSSWYSCQGGYSKLTQQWKSTCSNWKYIFKNVGFSIAMLYSLLECGVYFCYVKHKNGENPLANDGAELLSPQSGRPLNFIRWCFGTQAQLGETWWAICQGLIDSLVGGGFKYK